MNVLGRVEQGQRLVGSAQRVTGDLDGRAAVEQGQRVTSAFDVGQHVLLGIRGGVDHTDMMPDC